MSFVDDDEDLCPSIEEEELCLPRASINKIIKEIVPALRVAANCRELILNCCTEFIHLISSEANEICNQKNKKTINAEHILEGLNKLGFSDFTRDALNVLNECKVQAAKRRRQSNRLENLGISEEELLRQQQELIQQAREQINIEFQQQQYGLQIIENKENCDDDDDDDDY
jgi:histone H3/H4